MSREEREEHEKEDHHLLDYRVCGAGAGILAHAAFGEGAVRI